MPYSFFQLQLITLTFQNQESVFRCQNLKILRKFANQNIILDFSCLNFRLQIFSIALFEKMKVAVFQLVFCGNKQGVKC